MSGTAPPARPAAGQRVLLALAALSAAWALIVVISGGIDTSILGVRVRANEWSDPAVVALIAYGVFLWRRRAAMPGAARVADRLAASMRALREPGNLVLAAILAVAALARFWALDFGLPHPAARPDEEAVSALAGGYLTGSLEQTVFTYPPLFMLTVAAAIWLVFRKGPALLSRLNLRVAASQPSTAAVRLVARVLSAITGVLSVLVLFRIGQRLFGRTTGTAAAACLALAFLHVRDSHFGVTDIPMTFMVLVAFHAIVRLSESGSTRDLVAASVWTGLAVATKYNAALLALPASLAILDDPLRRPFGERLLRTATFGAAMTLAFLVITPYSLVFPAKFLADVSDVSRHLSEGHGVDLGRGWTYHLTTTLRHGLGLPLLAAGLAGQVLMLWRDRRRGLLVALFPLAYYLVTGTGRTVFARYILPAIPFLCLTAGYLVATLGASIAASLRRPGWRVPITAMMTALVVWPSALSVLAFDRLVAREDTRVTARRWIEARFAPGTTIAQIGPTNAHPYIYYEDRYALAEIDPAARPEIVVVASSPMGAPNVESLAPWLARDYELQLEQQVVAEDDPRHVYDRQDEFFVPLAGFRGVERPGPNLRIYVRRGEVLARLRLGGEVGAARAGLVP
jgi:hypothetical protein